MHKKFSYHHTKFLQSVQGIGAYTTLIGVNMASKHNVNLVPHKPGLMHYSHGFTFHVMIIVAIIPR